MPSMVHGESVGLSLLLASLALCDSNVCPVTVYLEKSEEGVPVDCEGLTAVCTSVTTGAHLGSSGVVCCHIYSLCVRGET